MSEDDDPFERLDDVEREGDPFERLDDADVPSGDDAGEDDPQDGDPDPSDGEVEPPHGAHADQPVRDGTAERGVPEDPFAEFDRDAASPTDGQSAATEPAADESDVPDEGAGGPAVDPFSDEPDREGDPFGGGESVFERVDVGEVDADEIWDSMTDDGEADEPAVPDESRYAEVSKHAYCQQCEYFSEPPDSHCTHETAEIIEYLDMDRVRLLDCPIVAERAELE